MKRRAAFTKNVTTVATSRVFAVEEPRNPKSKTAINRP